jgi:hypothetical protein
MLKYNAEVPTSWHCVDEVNVANAHNLAQNNIVKIIKTQESR